MIANYKELGEQSQGSDQHFDDQLDSKGKFHGFQDWGVDLV